MNGLRSVATAGLYATAGMLATQALATATQVQQPRHVETAITPFVISAPAFEMKSPEISRPVMISIFKLSGGSKSTREESLWAEVRKYGRLNQGWDGYDAEAPSTEAMNDLQKFLNVLPPGIAIPSLTLASSGLPSLYWDERDFFADLEFAGDGACSLYARAKVGSETKLFLEYASLNDAASSLLSELETIGA